MNSKDIHKALIGPNIFALYENGEFQTTNHIRDGWIMLIDIGRHRHTIVKPEKGIIIEPRRMQIWGQLWRNHNVEHTDTYLVVDNDYMVHQSVRVTQYHFDKIKAGTCLGVLEMEARFYLKKDGDFDYMLK